MAYVLVHPHTNVSVILTSDDDRDIYVSNGWQEVEEKKEAPKRGARSKRGTASSKSDSK